MASVAHLITRAEAIAKRINLSDKVAVVVQAPEPIPGSAPSADCRSNEARPLVPQPAGKTLKSARRGRFSFGPLSSGVKTRNL